MHRIFLVFYHNICMLLKLYLSSSKMNQMHFFFIYVDEFSYKLNAASQQTMSKTNKLRLSKI